MINQFFDQDLLTALSAGDRRLLEDISQCRDGVGRMNIQELADTVYTSPASIIRLCKKLGLEGFSELKYLLKPEWSVPGSDPAMELRGVIEARYRELSRTAASFTAADLSFVADCLCSDRNIYLFGRGMSYMPITYMHQVLMSVDRDCLCYIDPPLMYHAAAHMTADDVVFIASSGGATEAIRKAAGMARDHQATVIALTADPDSALAGNADILFHCTARRRYLNEIDITSRFTMMFAIDVILECYLNRLNLNPPSDPQLYLNQKNW